MAESIPFVAHVLDWRAPLILVLTIIVYSYIRKKKSPSLPPGPRGLPFIGNVLDVPNSNQWLTFAELGEVYGDIMSLTAFGQTLVILNSHKVAEELLEGRGKGFRKCEKYNIPSIFRLRPSAAPPPPT
ncbi:hypothetical protein DFH06DRAFT_1347578 [Mycena polygramma]|nr:hypothetical protein DFH06DRAFT_1347578 [Mycena polygramma]